MLTNPRETRFFNLKFELYIIIIIINNIKLKF